MKKYIKKKTAFRWLTRNQWKYARYIADGFGLPKQFKKQYEICMRSVFRNEKSM